MIRKKQHCSLQDNKINTQGASFTLMHAMIIIDTTQTVLQEQ